jgi:hypothetical protein
MSINAALESISHFMDRVKDALANGQRVTTHVDLGIIDDGHRADGWSKHHTDGSAVLTVFIMAKLGKSPG